MTATGARLDRRAPLAAVRGDVRAAGPWAARLSAGVAFALALVLGDLGCTDLATAPVISGVRPPTAYSDVPVALLVDAPMLRQALVVDIGGDSAHYDQSSIQMALVGEEPGLPSSVPLGPVQLVQDPTYLTEIPADLPAGMYGLRVVPPDGHTLILHAAFQELGPDMVPPTVIVDAPSSGATVGVGTMVTAMLRVDDGVGELGSVIWSTTDGSSGTCLLSPQPVTNTPPARTMCQAQFTVAPIAPDAGPSPSCTLHIEAMDVSTLTGTLDVPLLVANVPQVDSFENSYGSLLGNQPFTVHGQYFAAGAQAFIGGVAITGNAPTYVLGGDLLDDGTIVGLTPPNTRAQEAVVEVRAPAGAGRADATFRYVSPPHPRAVEPMTSPTAGGVIVTVSGNDLLYGVTIAFGDTMDDAQPMIVTDYEADDKVVGYVPPGQPGTVSVFAIDPITGTGELMGAFTYSDDVGDGAGVSAPSSVTAAAK